MLQALSALCVAILCIIMIVPWSLEHILGTVGCCGGIVKISLSLSGSLLLLNADRLGICSSFFHSFTLLFLYLSCGHSSWCSLQFLWLLCIVIVWYDWHFFFPFIFSTLVSWHGMFDSNGQSSSVSAPLYVLLHHSSASDLLRLCILFTCAECWWAYNF